ncbi:hypothetical protein [Burkholderia ubonensis]|uniref:hypothetical protein n=1 Tax=Burkholderia ubonensis TaxID=101571 RepID=UPI000AFD7878|nr:hypothetical protein [Burkholderia ubonensis]
MEFGAEWPRSILKFSIRETSSVGMASLVGAVFGVALYAINFYGMTRWSPWFADARNWASLFSHVVFGLVASDTYLRLEGKKTGTDATNRAA